MVQLKIHSTVPSTDVALSERARLQRAMPGFDDVVERMTAMALSSSKLAAQLRTVGDAGQIRLETVRAELHAAVDARCDQLLASLGYGTA